MKIYFKKSNVKIERLTHPPSRKMRKREKKKDINGKDNKKMSGNITQ